MPLQYDPEFAQDAAPVLKLLSETPRPAVHDTASRRAALHHLTAQMPTPDLPDDMERIVYHVPAADNHPVPIYHYRKKQVTGKAPAIVHMHGGGYISLDGDKCEGLLVAYVAATGVQFLSVDYRLAPEHPYPAAVDDAWAALQWISSHAEELSIDASRIGVLGESAGGGLAAGLALLARDRGLSPPIAKQILIYPMLDDRTVTNHAGNLAFWTEDDNVTAWTAYLGKDVPGTDDVSVYAAPARADSVEGLPPLYLDVPGLDIFVHEDAEYVRRFLVANIPTEFHIYPRLPHGFEGLAPMSNLVRQAMANRFKAIQSI
ncbi:hypothetical protein FE257_003351 [Aspergillus nanangensis]|uniref:Alpha/beta hydrolase fold-3 domain-containing protein n=1 Tax=Aspergillus nanangensis TaxID=2582783 RepID=A0AAD4GWI2_ASPNN|nr:hypothetical protein FE257_003351 [Aspergillus nanangensis]